MPGPALRTVHAFTPRLITESARGRKVSQSLHTPRVEPIGAHHRNGQVEPMSDGTTQVLSHTGRERLHLGKRPLLSEGVLLVMDRG